MRVKTYTVDDVRSAFKLIKGDLGESAVVISTKPVAGGRYEIIAAAEETKDINVKGNPRPDMAITEPHNLSIREYSQNPHNFSIREYSQSPQNLSIREFAQSPAKQTINRHEEKKPVSEDARESFLPEIHKQALFLLINSGIPRENALLLLGRYGIGEKLTMPVELARSVLIKGIKTMNDESPKGKSIMGGGVHVFSGMPGEGKTSLIMKVAFMLQNTGQNVAVITTDHAKIAAGEELRRFCEWSNIPFFALDRPDEFTRLVRDETVVLVDTPGNPFSDNMYGSIFSEDTVHHVIDATRENHSAFIREIYCQRHYLAITKADLATSGGTALKRHFETGMPLSFISTGSKVPDDIMVATPEKLCLRALKSNNETKEQTKKSWIKRLAGV
jgi:flagellar biosynthesis GTPase FlhF